MQSWEAGSQLEVRAAGQDDLSGLPSVACLVTAAVLIALRKASPYCLSLLGQSRWLWRVLWKLQGIPNDPNICLQLPLEITTAASVLTYKSTPIPHDGKL